MDNLENGVQQWLIIFTIEQSIMKETNIPSFLRQLWTEWVSTKRRARFSMFHVFILIVSFDYKQHKIHKLNNQISHFKRIFTTHRESNGTKTNQERFFIFWIFFLVWKRWMMLKLDDGKIYQVSWYLFYSCLILFCLIFAFIITKGWCSFNSHYKQIKLSSAEWKHESSDERVNNCLMMNPLLSSTRSNPIFFSPRTHIISVQIFLSCLFSTRVERFRNKKFNPQSFDVRNVVQLSSLNLSFLSP